MLSGCSDGAGRVTALIAASACVPALAFPGEARAQTEAFGVKVSVGPPYFNPMSALFVVLAMPVFTRMRAETDAMTPEKTLFKFSIVYLFVLFAALVADRVAAYQGWIA